jgi:ATP-dependent DNA helicase RecQ
LKEKSYKNKDKKTIELVRKLPHPMIIYVARPVDAERIKELLAENGINNVYTYTGLTKNNQREQLLKDWKADKYEIIIATSAFGVGVDKPDVRTVLHLYIPQNPNAYYQELGRGGRDHLPCLSVLCTYPDDLKAAFQRINKRVMTTEKIVGRWDSMYIIKHP